jgi:hypothetical protein
MAMDIHKKLTRSVVAYLPEKALSRQEQRSRPHKDRSYTWDETYTLPENFFLAYQRSGDSFYRDMAKKYLEDDTYFNPLSEGNNILPFEHSYNLRYSSAVLWVSKPYIRQISITRFIRSARAMRPERGPVFLHKSQIAR